MNNKIAIIGYGGFAKEVYYHLLDDNYSPNNIKFYVDAEYADHINCFDLSTISIPSQEILIAIGNPLDRIKIQDKLPLNTKYFTYIHSSVKILDSSVRNNIGEGTIICAGNILTTNIKIGNHVHLNLNCTVGHDTIIENNVTVSPGVNISGNCHIYPNTYIGTNAAIREKITIAEGSIIGMNAAVVKNTNKKTMYVGVPAKEKN